MAALAKHLSFLMLLCLASSLQSQARESQFFSKTVRYDNTKEQNVMEKPVPMASVRQDQTTITSQSERGYGLYGNGPNELPPSTTGNSPSQLPTNEYSLENYEQKQSDTSDLNTEYQNMHYGRSKLPTNEYGAENYKQEESYKGYLNNEYQNKQYGLSDTRYLENGNYFSYVKDDNQRSKYDYEGYENNERNRYNNEGYENYERSKYNYGGYENSERADEFNTSMEGYENQEEYVP